jgi:hypothetical protein
VVGTEREREFLSTPEPPAMLEHKIMQLISQVISHSLRRASPGSARTAVRHEYKDVSGCRKAEVVSVLN